jgi:DNA replication ATP-dependent helicase Dna2
MIAGSRSSPPTCGDEVDPTELGSWLTDHPLAVVGSTVWACLKLEDPDRRFDLVILDEASQVRVPESSIAVSLVAPKGRLVLAGDHLKLPPIVAGVYPEPAEGQPVLHRSIFELVQSRCKPDQEDGPCRQLLENFRMNDVLTSYAAGLLYGPRYRCADDEVAARRLKLKTLAGASELVAACLDPKHSLVIVIIEGAPAARENLIEAQLVSDLIGALRDHQLDRKGKSPYGKDADFFREGLFVVSPHHAQIGMIRRALAAQRDWTSSPFVDTVDKMQGQEADAVVVSYGVSDAEFAMQEAEFIYGLNRLNVAITRARSKCVVCLPAPLLESSPEVLDIEAAEQGLAYMQQLVAAVTATGETLTFDLEGGVRARVLRTGGQFPAPMAWS